MPELHELHIDFSPLLNAPCIVILIGWKRGISWSVIVGGETERHYNPFEESLFPIEFLDHQCLRQWTQQIPVEIVSLLWRYKGNAIGMLMMISRNKPALNMFLQRPTLFWLLFRCAQQNGWTEAHFVDCCDRNTSELMQLINLPSSNTAIEILNKITAPHFAQHQQEIIQQLFERDYEWLNVRNDIPDDLIRFLLSHWEYRNSALMKCWQGNAYSKLTNAAFAIQQLAGALELDYKTSMNQIYDCVNLAKVELLQYELLQQQAEQVLLVYQNIANDAAETPIKFPAPPFAGTDDIVPITSFTMLLNESQLLRHHMVSYSSKIETGQYYAYQVLYPECATLLLLLFRSEDGVIYPVIKKLLTFDSKPVSTATFGLVTEWLNQQKVKS